MYLVYLLRVVICYFLRVQNILQGLTHHGQKNLATTANWESLFRLRFFAVNQ